MPDGFDKFLAAGNEHADAKAKEARGMHPQYTDRDRDDMNMHLRYVFWVLKCMAAVLPLWPALPGQLERGQPLPARPPRAFKGASAHQWRPIASRFQCRRCLEHSNAASRALLCSGPCHPVPKVFAKIAAENRGHLLRVFASDAGPFYICMKCGSYAHRVPRGLAKDCQGKAPEASVGARNLKRIASQKHPQLQTCRVWPLSSRTPSRFEAELYRA